jgi:hypothetical protein
VLELADRILLGIGMDDHAISAGALRAPGRASSTGTEDGRNPLSELKAFQKLQEGIGDRCDEPPVVTELTEIGSFRLFSD